MVNKPGNVSGAPNANSSDANSAAAKDADLSREERLALALRRNLLKRKAQSRGRSAAAGAEDGNEDGSGA